MEFQAPEMEFRYRGGAASGVTAGVSSEEYSDNSGKNESLQNSPSSNGTQTSVPNAASAKTFRCTAMTKDAEDNVNIMDETKRYQWTLSVCKSNRIGLEHFGTIRADLASPEDVSLDTDRRTWKQVSK